MGKTSPQASRAPLVKQALLQALGERERTRWYQLGQESHLSFNPDLPLVDQVAALATLTAAGDQPCAMALLAAMPNQAEVTRIGAEALALWAHRLNAGGAIAVVDEGGNLVYLERLENTFPAATTVAIEKARTAATFRARQCHLDHIVD